jgi:hypothetical protein
MSKLAAAIRNHFVLVPCIEAKASPGGGSRRNLAPIGQSPGASGRVSSVLVSKLPAASLTRLHPAEPEAMNASAAESYPHGLTPALLPDAGLASLAGKAPAVCSQLPRMAR